MGVSRLALTLLLLGSEVSGPSSEQAGRGGKCPDHAMSGGTSNAQLAKDCVKCITSSKAAGCAKPKFCPGITGEPWCGSAKTTECDTGIGTKPGALTLECCQQYVNSSVAEQCGGKPECPDKQMSKKTYDQLSGTAVSLLCDACFDLGAASGCETIHFCPEETG